MTTLTVDTLDRLRAAGSDKWSRYPGKIGAWVAEMDFGTAPVVTRALHEAVDDGVLGYVPQPLTARLCTAYSRWALAEHGWDVPPDRVRVIGDVLSGLQAVIQHLTPPGSAVIVPTPAYMPFLTLPGLLGREVVQVPMATSEGRYVHDLDALDAAFRAGGGLLVLCNPHNPVGRVLERAELAAVAEVVDRHGGRVFADEIHAPLVFAGHRHVPYASISDVAAGHTVTATSASKAWNLPGLKCAQLVLSADADADVWSRVGGRTESGASTLGVVANTAAYSEGRPWLAQVLAALDANRRHLGALLAERIPAVDHTAPEATYLAWLDCRALGLDRPAQEFFLEEADVALTDGALCGDAGTGFVRLNFATPRPVLDEIVDRMARALERR